MRVMQSQQAPNQGDPSNLEDFDYDIPIQLLVKLFSTPPLKSLNRQARRLTISHENLLRPGCYCLMGCLVMMMRMTLGSP